MLVTFEGLDGSGKTIQMELLADFWRKTKMRVVTTREPGGTELSERVRTLLLDTDIDVNARAEVLMFNAARAQLVEEVIRPALAGGAIVLCDRFYDSTIAYQGYGHGQSVNVLRSMISYAVAGVSPDLTIFLDVPLEVGLERAGGNDRIEQNKIEFFDRVRHGYGSVIRENPDRWRVIDANRSVESVHDDVVKAAVAFKEHHFFTTHRKIKT